MTPRDHLSMETLDLLHLDALPPQARAQAETHLAGCATCQSRHTQLEEDASRFVRSVLPRTLPQVEQRARQERWQWTMAGWVLASAVAVLLFLVARPSTRPEEAPYLAARGEGFLRVIAQRGERQVEVEPETVLREGDRLRFVVDPGEARQVLVVSRDGAGRWTVYAPYAGARSTPVGAGMQALPGSIELDATRGVEHVIALLSDAPLDAAAVLRMLKAQPWPPSGAVEVPGARAVWIRSFRKE